MYAHFFLLWLADILANLSGYLLLNWWTPLLADDAANLPQFLRWFQTHDANLDGVGTGGGIEPRFIEQTRWFRNGDTPKNRLCRYICRVMWLYRNNAYGFAYDVLGAVGPFVQTTWFGDSAVTNRSPAVAGFCFQRWVNDEGENFFHFWWVKPWGFGKCWEANIGWKINPSNPRAQFVWRIWPFRAYEK